MRVVSVTGKRTRALSGDGRLPRSVVRPLVRLTQRLPLELPIPVRLRRRLVELAARSVPVPAGTRISSATLGGVPSTRVEHESADPALAILYLHGGGYTVGSAVTHRGLATHLSRAAAAPVHLLEYRLAPDHRHPAALDDALAAYRGLLEAGIAAERVAIAGDSAGGGLTLATAMRLRDDGSSLPAMLGLISPWLDLTNSGASFESRARRDVGLSATWIRECAALYAGTHDARAPELSPLWGDLAGLPPLYVQAATEEILTSDADRLAERAREGGVELDYRRYPGLWHDFQLCAGRLREADQAVEELAAALAAAWARPLSEA